MSSSSSSGLPFGMTTPQAVHSTTFTVPLFSATVEEMFDHHLVHSAQHPCYAYEDDTSPTGDGVRVLTWSDVAQAAHRVARSLLSRFEREEGETSSTSSRRTVAILANSNTQVYQAVIQGTFRAGQTSFPISPRNSAPAVVELLRKTGAKYLYVSNTVPAVASLAAEVGKLAREAGHDVVQIDMPAFHDVYPHIPFDGKRVEHPQPFEPLPAIDQPSGPDAPLLILHSSGTTGFPKPIVLTQRNILQWTRFPFYGSRDLCSSVFGAMPLPGFHAMGTVFCFIMNITSGITTGLFPPTDPPVIPTAERTLDSYVKLKCNMAASVPAFLEEWSRDPAAIEVLAKLDNVTFGGAPLSKVAGDRLAQGDVNIFQVYGSTEVGNIVEFPPREPMGMDWEYFRISSHVSHRWVSQEDGSESFELRILAADTFLPAVLNADEGRSYATSDLCVPHPTRDGLWKVVGRADDQITLSTGEKTSPQVMEHLILDNPLVAQACMFGRGRLNNGVLIEPKQGYHIDPSDEDALAAFRNAIWPDVEKANAIAPTHSRIFKEMIVVTDPSRPFQYTPKRTVKRQLAIIDYAPEIEAAYAAVAESSVLREEPPERWTKEGTRGFIEAVVRRVMKGRSGDALRLGEDDDLFLSGCDSLQATVIRNMIINALRSRKISASDVTQSFVYRNPTIASLSSAVLDLVSSKTTTTVAGGAAAEEAAARVKAMEEVVEELTKDFPAHRAGVGATVSANGESDDGRGEGEVVVLTGSTGGLGSHLLEQLALSPSVRKVYALNRRGGHGRSLGERQASAFEERGLDAALLDGDKVSLVEARTELPKLGLDDDLYAEVSRSTTLIIHNAWRLDFNLSLSSYRPNLLGVRHLIDLALSSPATVPPRFVFASSIATLSSWDEDRPAPEEPIRDAAVAVGMGYGESKFVAERVLEAASASTALKTASVRIGQLTGSSVTGAWSVTDWVPMIVQSAEALGCLPGGSEDITWLPINKAASVMLDVCSATKALEEDERQHTFHLVHPRPTKWSAVFGPVAETVGVPLVPYAQWFALLEREAEGKKEEVGRTPATRILDFYRAALPAAEDEVGKGKDKNRTKKSAVRLNEMETSKTQAASATVRSLEPLAAEEARKWVAYWRRKGFLSDGAAAANGHPNEHANGRANGHANGHANSAGH